MLGVGQLFSLTCCNLLLFLEGMLNLIPLGPQVGVSYVNEAGGGGGGGGGGGSGGRGGVCVVFPLAGGVGAMA